jgi:hypothetical protein
MQQSEAACFDREGVAMNRISVVTAVVLALSLIQLSGCAATSASTGGRSPSYAKGFDDGCQSGKAWQGSPFDQTRKDVGRFETDKEYAQGWTDAFQKCADEQVKKNASGGGN